MVTHSHVRPRRSARRGSYAEVRERLDQVVAELAARGRRQLPSEEDLSAYLGASRSTVRSALMSLEQEGKLQRLHGLGTFVNRLALDVRANIVQDRPFLDVLRALGHAATVSVMSMGEVDAPPDVLARLRLDGPARAWRIERLWLASGTPAVFAIDYVPSGYLCVEPDPVSAGDSVFAFVSSNTDRSIRYSIAELIPTVPAEQVTRALNVPPGAAVLLLLHTHVDHEDVPVAVTHAYLNDGIVRFSVVRQDLVTAVISEDEERPWRLPDLP